MPPWEDIVTVQCGVEHLFLIVYFQSSNQIFQLLLMGNKLFEGYPGGSKVKNLPANVGNVSLIPGWGRPPGEGNDNPL